MLTEPSTLRALERRSEGVFACGVVGFLCGVGLSLFEWGLIGLPLLASAVVLLVEMGWITWTLHEPCEEHDCPLCSATNEVFHTRRAYRCDKCGSEVVVRNGGWTEGPEGCSP